MVQHLSDLTTSTTKDSTTNNNDATKRVANEPSETDGKIAKAQSFDGINDYEKITNNFIVNPTSLTISSWIKKESGGHTYECALHKGSSNTIGSSDYWLGVCVNDYLTATIGANQVGWAAGKTTTAATYGVWYHLAATWDGSVVRVYLNGVYNKQYNLNSYGNLTTPTRFGASADGTNYQFKGEADEMRISTIYRSANWILTSYNTQSFPSAFMSFGSEEMQSSYTLSGDIDVVALRDPERIDFSTTKNVVNYVFADNTDIQLDKGKSIDQIIITGLETSTASANMNSINTFMDNQEEITVAGLSDTNLNTEYIINSFSFNQEAGWVDRYSYVLTLERLHDRLG